VYTVVLLLKHFLLHFCIVVFDLIFNEDLIELLRVRNM